MSKPTHEFNDGNDFPGGAEAELRRREAMNLPLHIGGYQHMQPDVVCQDGDILVRSGRPVCNVAAYIGYTVEDVEAVCGLRVYRKYPVAKQGDNDDTGWKGVRAEALRKPDEPTVAAAVDGIWKQVAGNGPLPTDAKARKAVPVYSGFIKYFPRAIAEVARVSQAGNDQHNPGKPLHWDRSKSGDELDALSRHLLEAGGRDTDGQRHSAKLVWRGLANLEKELEREEK